MPGNEFDVGTVFKWTDFDEPKFGLEIKPRWFIFLGTTSTFIEPVFCFISTTTTQIKEFESGGKRASHEYLLFKSSDGIFEEDCVIDFREKPYSIEKSKVESSTDIEIKGKLNMETMRRIYKGLLKSQRVSRKEMLDIHQSFNLAGIEGLKKP